MMKHRKKGVATLGRNEAVSFGPAGFEPETKETNETSLRRSSFLRATQSDRITVLVGPSRIAFQVPQDLLIQWSPPLGEMCRSGLEESQTRVIPLPHVKISTFEDFFIWMHAYEPRVDIKDFTAVLDLAIFAEMYMIFQLKNQTSDILRTELGSGRWKLTPDNVSKIYDEVPSGSILRLLCSSSLALPVSNQPSSSPSFGFPGGFGGLQQVMSSPRQHEDFLKWEPIFENHSDLGWDYFRQIQMSYTQTAISWGGPCRFHDHRDIPGERREAVDKCPYPYGALPTERPSRALPEECEREAFVEVRPVETQPAKESPHSMWNDL